MRKVNAYLREQGFDVKFTFGTSKGRLTVQLYRTRKFKEHIGWTTEKTISRYSIGRFKFEDLEANLLKPRRQGWVGRNSEGWQNYPEGWYDCYAQKMNFKLPKFTTEQVKTIMDLILLARLAK